MRKLQSVEIELTGNWLKKNKSVIEDEACHRIEWLIKTQLQYIATDSSGWEKLYRDLKDNRLWELTYPHSEWHGGGPPRLKVIAPETAALKYDFESA